MNNKYFEKVATKYESIFNKGNGFAIELKMKCGDTLTIVRKDRTEPLHWSSYQVKINDGKFDKFFNYNELITYIGSYKK